MLSSYPQSCRLPHPQVLNSWSEKRTELLGYFVQVLLYTPLISLVFSKLIQLWGIRLKIMDAGRLTLAILGANFILLPINLAISQKSFANAIAQPPTAFSYLNLDPTNSQENTATRKRGEKVSPNISRSTAVFSYFSLKEDEIASPPASIAQILLENSANSTTTQTAPDSLAKILGEIISPEVPNLGETISPNVRSQLIPNPSTTESETQLQPNILPELFLQQLPLLLDLYTTTINSEAFTQRETDLQTNIISQLLVQQLPLLSDIYSTTINLQASTIETQLQRNIVSELLVQQLPLLSDIYTATISLQVATPIETNTPPPPVVPPPPPAAPVVVAPPAAPVVVAPPPAPVVVAPPPAPVVVAPAASPPPVAPVFVAPPPPPPPPVVITPPPPPPPPPPAAPPPPPPPPPPAQVAIAQQPPPPPSPPPAPKPVPPAKPQIPPQISSAYIQEQPISANPIWWIPLAIIAGLTTIVIFLLETQTFRRRRQTSANTPNVEFAAISDAGKQTIPSNQPLSMNFNMGLAIRLDTGRQTLNCSGSLVSGAATRGNL